MLCLLVVFQSHTDSSEWGQQSQRPHAGKRSLMTMPCNHSGVGSHEEGISFDSARLELNSAYTV
jgi:hypothetical protein